MLAVRAEEAGATRLYDAFYATGAGGALAILALAPVNGESVLEISHLAAGAPVIAQARTACGNGIQQHGPDMAVQVRHLGFRQPGRLAEGGYAAAPQGLADIDIAKSGNRFLIEQSLFDGCSAPVQCPGQCGCAEMIAKGFRPQMGKAGMILQPGFMGKLKAAESPWVGEDEAASVGEAEDHMVVAAAFGGERGVNGHAPRHAQMAKQDITTIEMHENVFGPALNAPDPLAADGIRHSLREGMAQPPGVQIQPVDARSGEFIPQRPAYGFDFG